MKTMKKIIALVMVFGILGGLLAGCSNSKEEGKTNSAVNPITPGKLTVATSPDFAPMEFVDATKTGQDKYVGFDVTLAKYIADELGLELVITPMSFDACQVAVTTGSADMSISGFSWTEKREQNYNISDYYHAGDNESNQILICLGAAGDKYVDAANMDGLKVGVQGSSLQEVLANEQLTKAEITVFGDLTTGLLQLQNGDFDVMAVAEGNGEAIIANNPDVAKTGFSFEVDPKYTDNVILLQKGNDQMTKAVNECLAKAKAADLYTGWYNDAKALSGIEVSYDDEGNEITD